MHGTSQPAPTGPQRTPAWLRRLAGRYSWQLAAAIAFGLAALVLAETGIPAGRSLFGVPVDLTWATWRMSAAMLALFEPQLVADEVGRTLTIGDYQVIVIDSCAGYDGIALLAVFTTVYLLALRRDLRFPLALLLYPAGFAAIWLLNSARIAALAAIAAHVSPDVAMYGFHSRGGWIVFLAVCSAELILAPLLLRPAAKHSGAAAPDGRVPMVVMNAHLMPFIAMMVSSILVASAAPVSAPFYPIVAIAMAAALYAFRQGLGDVRPAMPLVSTALGLALGAAWIATASSRLEASDLGHWLETVSPVHGALWLLVRGIGAIVLVPIVEELAFRGFLYRRILSQRFDLVPHAQLSIVALNVSAALFGALHDRWLAASLCGVVFTLLMVRRGRIGDAILAHAAANATIFAWAVLFGQWALL